MFSNFLRTHFPAGRLLLGVAILVAGMTGPCIGQTPSKDLYRFRYDFDSGAQLSGSFEGTVTPPGRGIFDDTVTVFPDNVLATFHGTSGAIFSWDTRLPEDTSSQAVLISKAEYAFVSLDGSKMDFVLSSGFASPVQIFLENGIQSDAGIPRTPNNASTNNVLPMDLAESFRPESWSLELVPEPTGSALLGGAAFSLGWAIRRRQGRNSLDEVAPRNSSENATIYPTARNPLN